MATRAKSNDSETKLVSQTIAALLQIPGVYAWRNNSGVFRTAARFVRFGQKGSPDIIACVNGRFVGFEAKMQGKKQLEDQVEWQQRIESVGGVYALIYSVSEAVDVVMQIQSGA